MVFKMRGLFNLLFTGIDDIINDLLPLIDDPILIEPHPHPANLLFF